MKGGVAVASNFQFFPHRTKNSLHMKLYGDFDEISALELLNALTDHGSGVRQIFIDTNDLSTIHPFGQEMFQKNIGSLNGQFLNLTFIGKNKHSISPEKSHHFDE